MKNDFLENQLPLAERARPKDWAGFFGQKDLTDEKAFLRRAIEQDALPSCIFWGPPGSGKTSLARLVAEKTQADFIQMSAVTSGKKDLLAVIKKAQENAQNKKKTILFIDEIHRWNKAQQDALLAFVEKGVVVLIGATTENPSFEINPALLSRTRLLVLRRLEKADLRRIIKNGLNFLPPQTKLSEEALDLLVFLSNGDARNGLNLLEAAAAQKEPISLELIKQIAQKSHLFYDKKGDEHYTLISALHKSLRGGDAHAAVYWLARMLEGGEDPLYVARRLVRFASEDVGLADNHALILANAVFEACHKVGMPECSVFLCQCVIYLAKTKKSILAYKAYNQAKKDVENLGNLPVPLHLRNASNRFLKEWGYGNDYKYSPEEDDSQQEYFPDRLKGRKYF